MRLTLRTLLAYLDQVLDPSDAESLRPRIASSQLATSLTQRIRTGLKRRQLSAPPVVGRGLGGDPNTVSEYLDDSLAHERVPEFERVCMESDIQLTEVAACHQVLTVVLGQPASITPELRKRIIELPLSPIPPTKKGLAAKTNATPGTPGKATKKTTGARPNIPEKPNAPRDHVRVDAAHTSSPSGNDSKTRDPSHSSEADSSFPDSLAKNDSLKKSKAKSQSNPGIDLADHRLAEKVPEYLRGRSSSGYRQIFIAASLLALLLLVAGMAIGSFQDLARMLGVGPSLDRSAENTTLPETNPNRDRASNTAPGLGSGQGNNANESGPKNETVPQNGVMSLPSSDSNPNPNSSLESDSAGGPLSASVTSPNGQAESEPPPFPAANTANAERPTPLTSKPQISVRWLPETRQQSEVVVLWAGLEKDAAWRRAAVGEEIPVASQILVPPAFRTDLRFESGHIWSLAGVTKLTVLPTSDSNRPRFDVAATRAIIRAGNRTDGQANPSDLEILLDAKHAVRIRFQTPATVIGLEVAPYWMAKQDSADRLHPIRTVQLMTFDGEISCQFITDGVEDGAAVPLPVGEVLGCSSEQAPVRFRMSEPPAWLRASTEPPINALAAADLHRLLMNVKAEEMQKQLMQLTTHKRPETAALATRTLCWIGDYDSLVGENSRLKTPILRAYWHGVIDDFRQSLALSEDRLAKLEERWRAIEPDQAENALQLLVGFAPKHLENGGDQALLQSLQSDAMQLRALAAYQLRRITQSDQGYLADQPSPESLQSLRKMLDMGKLRYVLPQVPFPEALAR